MVYLSRGSGPLTLAPCFVPKFFCCLQMWLRLVSSLALYALDKQVVTKWRIPFCVVKTRSRYVPKYFFSSLCLVYGRDKSVVLDWGDTQVATGTGQQTEKEQAFHISFPGLWAVCNEWKSHIHLMKDSVQSSWIINKSVSWCHRWDNKWQPVVDLDTGLFLGESVWGVCFFKNQGD